jgi:Glycosyl transferases group 1
VRRAAPRADVVFLASGPLAMQPTAPGVVTVLRVERSVDRASRRRWDRLRRAVGTGVLVHAPTASVADAVCERAGIDRAGVVVAAPGIRATRVPVDRAPLPGASVVVLAGESAPRDRAVLAALQAAGANAWIATGLDATATPSCCVLASPSDGFPLVALEAQAAGVALVAARSPTTTELLEGAAALVDTDATQDFVEAAMELCGNDAARAIAVAAGRARADDFTWARRSGEMQAVVWRSLTAK